MSDQYQPPQQQPQQPQQPPAGHQYPGPQNPGSQNPGSQYAGSQYAGSQYPGSQYPGSPYGAPQQPPPPGQQLPPGAQPWMPGQPPAPPKKKRWPWILGGIFLFILLVSMCSAALSADDDDDPAAVATTTEETSEEPTTEEPTTEEPTTEEPEPEPTVASSDETTAVVEGLWASMDLGAQQAECATYLDDKTAWLDDFGDEWDRQALKAFMNPTCAAPDMVPLTMSQENAIGKAQDYLDYTNFSREGLIGQLEYEEYSTEDATFAVDYLEENDMVDWNEQAAGKAQDYLDYTEFSRQGLIDQLLFEGFTQEQAEYGVEAVGY